MFQKAEKNELRTWFLGDAILLVVSLFVFVISVVTLFTTDFRAGMLVMAIISGSLLIIFAFLGVKIFKALRSFDERRQREKDKQKALEESNKAIEEQRLEEEAREMEALRRSEEEKRRETLKQIEKERQEALENEKNNQSEN